MSTTRKYTQLSKDLVVANLQRQTASFGHHAPESAGEKGGGEEPAVITRLDHFEQIGLQWIVGRYSAVNEGAAVVTAEIVAMTSTVATVPPPLCRIVIGT